MLRPILAPLALVLFACSGSSDGPGGGVIAVDAGPDQTLPEGQLVRLTGTITGSSASSATPLWFFAGGEAVVIHRAEERTCFVQLPEVAPGQPRTVTLGFAATTPNAAVDTDFVTLTVLPTDRIAYTADVTHDGQFEFFSFDAINGGVARVTPVMPMSATLTDIAIGPLRDELHFVADLVTDGDHEAWTVSVAGSTEVRINHDLVSGGDVFFTAPSPVDDSILYSGTLDDPGIGDCYALTAGRTVRTKLTELGAGSPGPSAQAWTPDGERVLLWGSLDGATGFALESVLPDGTGRLDLIPTFSGSQSVEELMYHFDSRRAVFRLWNPATDDVHIYSANWVTGEHVQLNANALAEDSLGVTLRISPDGSYVTYRANAGAAGNAYRVFAVAIDGSAHTEVHGQLAPFASVSRLLNWTEDSMRVVYLADADTDGEVELYSAARDGSGVTKLNAPLGAGESIDEVFGTTDGRFVYSVAADPPRFYSVAEDGTSHVQLDAVGPAGANVSLVGVATETNVALCSGEVEALGERVVVAAPLDGTARRTLHPGTLPAGANAWSLISLSPVGTHAVIGTVPAMGSAVELFVTDLATGTAQSMPSGNGGGLAGIDWARDGHALVYVGDYATLGKQEAFYIRATGTGFTRVNEDLPVHGDVDVAAWID